MEEPRSLEDMRARLQNGDLSPQGPYPNGGGRRQASPEPEGFDAADVWTFPYNLEPHVKASGHIPPPTQARIDRYQRSMARLQLKYVQALEKTDEAMNVATARIEEEQNDQASETEETSGLTDEEIDRQLDEAFAEKERTLDEFRGVIAEFCAGHPTRKQLDKLPENVLRAFIRAIGRKLNPEA